MLPSASRAAAWLALACLAIPSASALADGGASVAAGSVRLPDPGGLTIGRARIVRAQLTPEELSAQMAFTVALRMRELSGLQARVASGERVSGAELEGRYLPLRADYDRVVAWLIAQGFAQTVPDRLHMTVVARGSVAQVARAFGVRFARVSVPDGEYTSAVTEPSVPAELAAAVLGVNGLQPEFRLRHIRAQAVRARDVVGGYVFVTPDNVASAYHIPSAATGAGQIIAVIDEAPALSSDLASFWTAAGSAQTVDHVATIGSGAPSPTSSQSEETDLDVEWAGAIAPGALIRIYLSSPNVFEALVLIGDDMPSYPGMSVVSMSYCVLESDEAPGELQGLAQVMASYASSGLTLVASSGDSGSNPTTDDSFGNFSATAPLGVSYPACDPSVTGVGGSTVEFDGNWNCAGETVWDELSTRQSASGGGVSGYFQKPAWQTGGSVLASQSMRCVPDVAALSDADLTDVNLGPGLQPETVANVGVLVYSGGVAMAEEGTSLACPVWAGIAALVNQARSEAAMGPAGLLNPFLYPLEGTGVFNPITSGTNGAYSAGPTYNLCTGLGTPDVANLISALSSPAPAPSTHRLVDVSTRAEVETGANILIAGVAINGPAGTFKNILVRGVGPALTPAPFSVPGALAQPVVGVYDSNQVLIASNAGWGNPPVEGTSAVRASFRQATAADMASVGAFPLPAGSLDSAMVLSLPSGTYTVQVSGSGSSTGVALAEVYEVDAAAPEVLVNISARCFVSTGSGVAISGFVVEGSQPVQLLIRGVGPGLAAFGLSGSLIPMPSISVYDSTSTLIASNTGWGNPPVAGTSTVAATFRAATAGDMSASGAFALGAGSADSAMVMTLPPGSYTAIVSGVGGSTGTALAEVYEDVAP